MNVPPARCWADAAHVAPDPSCRCGYHCFTTFEAAAEYAELFTGPPSFVPARFVAACVPFSVCDRRNSGALIHGAREFRTGSLEYVALARPPRCECGAPSIGVAPRRGLLDGLDEIDTANGWHTLAAACRRHLDRDTTTTLAAMLPVVSHATIRRWPTPTVS